MIAALVADDPGPLATLQDGGRFGWQRFGVATAGAADALSFDIANRLVGNPAGAACVEFTLHGGTWRCEAESVRVAVCGGEFPVEFAGQRTSAWRSITLCRGDRLAIGPAKDAARGYVAVSGGFAVPPELGSRSVHLRSGIGGRALRPGDALPLAAAEAPPGPDLMLDPRLLPTRGGVLRVVLGPQDNYFSAAAVACFFAAEFRVTAEADRMGIKLAGPKIEHATGFNIISDGIAAGSVQVPGSGQPILLGPDRQTTGGYPKIATVITADLWKLGQLRPGDALRFCSVSLAEARSGLLEYDRTLERLHAAIAPSTDAGGMTSDRLLGLNLIGGVIDANEAPRRDGR